MPTTILPGNTGADQGRADYFFKPNIQLYDRALATKQKTYDDTLLGLQKIKAKVDQVNTLGTFDNQRHKEKQLAYEGKVNDLQKLYNGDLSKAQGEFQNLMSEVGDDFNVHGEMTALDSRYKGYQANAKNIQERRQKGEITKEQAWRLTRELNRTDKIGIGTSPDKWNGWNSVQLTDAVDQADFLDKYVKGYKADKNEQWGNPKKGPDGLLVWEKNGIVQAREADILRDASLALRKEMEKTGELESAWLYNKEVLHPDQYTDEGLQNIYNNKTSSTQNKVDNINQTITTLGQLGIKERQEAINKGFQEKGYPPPLVVDGKDGPNTKKFLVQLQESLNYDLENANDELANLKQGDPTAVAEQGMYDAWLSKSLKESVMPWANKAGFTEKYHDIKVMKDPIWAHQKEMQLRAMDHQYAFARDKWKYNKENPPVDHISRMDTGHTTEGKYGTTPEKFKENVATNIANGHENVKRAIQNALPLATTPEEERANQKIMTEIAAKITNQEVAEGQFIKDGSGNIYLATPSGEKKLITNNPNVDLSALTNAQNAARHTLQEKYNMDQVATETRKNILGNRNNYTEAEVKYMQGKEEREAAMDKVLDAEYDKYKADKQAEVARLNQYHGRIVSGIAGVFGANTIMSREDYKRDHKNVRKHAMNNKARLYWANEAVNNASTPEEKQAAQSKVNSLTAIKTYYDDVSENRDVLDRYETAYEDAIGKHKWHNSTSSSSYGYGADGVTDPKIIASRDKTLNNYVKDKANLSTHSMTFGGDVGPSSNMTPEQKLADYAAQNGLDPNTLSYEVGHSLPTEGQASYSVPFTIYQKTEDGVKRALNGGTAYLPMTQVKTTWSQEIADDPTYQIIDEKRSAWNMGAEKSQNFNSYDPISGGSTSYRWLTGTKDPNPNPHELEASTQLQINNFAVPVLDTYGNSVMEQKMVNGSMRTVPKYTYIENKVFGAEEGNQFVHALKNRQNIYKKMQQHGIPEEHVYVVDGDKSGYRSRTRELEAIKAENKNNLMDANEILRRTRNMGIQDYAAAQIFNLRNDGTRYYNKKHPGSAELGASHDVELIQYPK